MSQRMCCEIKSLNCIQEHTRERSGKAISVSLDFQKKYISAAFSPWKRTLHKYPDKIVSYQNITSTQVLQTALLQLLVISLWDNTAFLDIVLLQQCTGSYTALRIENLSVHRLHRCPCIQMGERSDVQRCKVSSWKENSHLCDCSPLPAPKKRKVFSKLVTMSLV